MMQVRKPSSHMFGEPDNHVKVLKDVYKAFRGNISFGKKGFKPGDPSSLATGLVLDNMDGVFIKVTVTNPNTPFTVNHTLNRVPIGFLVIRVNENANFWDGGAAWTSNTISLECNNNGAIATLFVF